MFAKIFLQLQQQINFNKFVLLTSQGFLEIRRQVNSPKLDQDKQGLCFGPLGI